MRALLLVALAGSLGAGRVQTRDGKTLDGAVSFADSAVVVRGAAETRVGLDQVARVVTSVRPPEEIVTAPTGSALPPGWRAQDIGEVKYAGSTACDAKGGFTLSASGYGAWGGKDSCQFAYQAMEGDGQVIAHVAKLDDSRGGVVAGVMIRETIAPDAPMATATLYGSGDVRLSRRPLAVPVREFKTGAEQNPQAWVRLTRRGDVFSAFRSNDGRYWEFIESHKVPMGKATLVGVTAWATGNAWTGGALLDSVRVVPGTPGNSYFPGGDPFDQGIVFRDGRVLACRIEGAEGGLGVRYEWDGRGFIIPLEQVARLVFSPVPPELARPTDKTGVLLTNGDFIDGEIAGVQRQQVEWPRPPQIKATVRSVLFGSRSFETAKEVISVDYGAVAPAAAAWEVRTADGSLVRAKEVKVQGAGVLVDGKALADVVEIRKL